MEDLSSILHREQCSLVVKKGSIHLFHQPGVADLLCLLKQVDAPLHDADIADKVVGKAAAALLIPGKVRQVYADTISEDGLSLLKQYTIKVTYGRKVLYIENRSHTGLCPMEEACQGNDNPQELLVAIENRITQMRQSKSNTVKS